MADVVSMGRQRSGCGMAALSQLPTLQQALDMQGLEVS
jgi:hypothetical protein